MAGWFATELPGPNEEQELGRTEGFFHHTWAKSPPLANIEGSRSQPQPSRPASKQASQHRVSRRPPPITQAGPESLTPASL